MLTIFSKDIHIQNQSHSIIKQKKCAVGNRVKGWVDVSVVKRGCILCCRTLNIKWALGATSHPLQYEYLFTDITFHYIFNQDSNFILNPLYFNRMECYLFTEIYNILKQVLQVVYFLPLFRLC